MHCRAPKSQVCIVVGLMARVDDQPYFVPHSTGAQTAFPCRSGGAPLSPALFVHHRFPPCPQPSIRNHLSGTRRNRPTTATARTSGASCVRRRAWTGSCCICNRSAPPRTTWRTSCRSRLGKRCHRPRSHQTRSGRSSVAPLARSLWSLSSAKQQTMEGHVPLSAPCVVPLR